jgi:hypothetical protein
MTASITGRGHIAGQMVGNTLGNGRTASRMNSLEFVERVGPKTEPVPEPEPESKSETQQEPEP